VLFGLIGQAFSNSAGRVDDPLGVAVSPQTLLLSSDQGGRVTVHTSIPCSSVDRGTLALNGVPVSSVGADALGHLVAGFDEAAIKAVVTPPEAVMTLTGSYTDGTAFAGSDTVRVVE
jgi:hypothetical protein